MTLFKHTIASRSSLTEPITSPGWTSNCVARTTIFRETQTRARSYELRKDMWPQIQPWRSSPACAQDLLTSKPQHDVYDHLYIADIEVCQGPRFTTGRFGLVCKEQRDDNSRRIVFGRSAAGSSVSAPQLRMVVRCVNGSGTRHTRLSGSTANIPNIFASKLSPLRFWTGR